MKRRPLPSLLVLLTLLSQPAIAQKVFVDGAPLHTLNAATRAKMGALGPSGNFDGMRFSADSTRLFTYNETLRRIYIANTSTNALLDSVSFTSFVYDFMPGPGNSLYFSQNPTTRIYKMDLSTKTVVDSSAVIAASGAAVFTPRPGSSEIWFAMGEKVQYFTTASMALNNVPARVPSGYYIGTDLVFDRSGSKLYYCPAQPTGQSGKLYQMDAITKAHLDSLETPAALGRVKTLRLSGDDTTMYLAYWGVWPNEPSKIYRASALTMNMLDSVNTPRKPFDIAERPGTQELWVVYHYDAKIGILNRAANFSSIDSIQVGINPKMLLFMPMQATGVAGSTSRHAITVVPNPSSGSFLVECKGSGAGYRVLDLSGRCLLSGRLQARTELLLNDVPAGIYLLQVYGAGWQETIRLLKQ